KRRHETAANQQRSVYRANRNYSSVRSVKAIKSLNNHASIHVLPPFESAVADEITEQLIDLYARRAAATERKDWAGGRRLDVEMDGTSLLREAIGDGGEKFELT